MGKGQRKFKRKIRKTGVVFAAAFIVIGIFICLLSLPSFKFSSDKVKIEAGSTFEARAYITKVRNINITQTSHIKKRDCTLKNQYFGS